MVRNARSVLKDALEAEYEGSAFVRNIGCLREGCDHLGRGPGPWRAPLPPEDGFAGLFAVGWMSIWWGVVLTFLWFTLKGLFQGKGIASRVGSVFMLLFLIPFVGGGVMAPLGMLLGAGSPRLYLLIGTAVLLGVMNLVFFYLLRAPTAAGPQAAGRDRRLPPLSDDRGRRTPEGPASAGEDAGAVRALSSLCAGTGLRERMERQVRIAVLAAAAMAGAAAARLVLRAQLGCRTHRELHRQPGQQPAIERGLGLDGAGQQFGLGRRRIVGRRWRRRRRIGLVGSGAFQLLALHLEFEPLFFGLGEFSRARGQPLDVGIEALGDRA